MVMECLHCARVRWGTLERCPVHTSEREVLMMKSTAALMARQRERAEAKRRKYWGQWKVGDGVLLSASKSAELKRVFDDEGSQIRFDGVVKEIGDVYALVWVLMQTGREAWGVTLYARPGEMTPNEGVTTWASGQERAMDRKRKTGSVETEFWAPL